MRKQCLNDPLLPTRSATQEMILWSINKENKDNTDILDCQTQ